MIISFDDIVFVTKIKSDGQISSLSMYKYNHVCTVTVESKRVHGSDSILLSLGSSSTRLPAEERRKNTICDAYYTHGCCLPAFANGVPTTH